MNQQREVENKKTVEMKRPNEKVAAVNEIVVDDGAVEVPVKNRLGEQVGVFFFHPTDVGIIDRYNEVMRDFEKITEPLTQTNIKPDGTADGDAETAALKEAEKRLYEAVDYLFAGNMAEAFFGSMHPFSPVGGVFYCERAIESVGQYISTQFDRETEKIKKRVGRYTKKYHKRGGKR